jgi:superfamily II DNA or RNA helicase
MDTPVNNQLNTKITKYGYIVHKKSLDEAQTQELKNDLTVEPIMQFGNFVKSNKFPIYLENGDYFGVPKYYGLEKFGPPAINRLETYPYPVFDMKYQGKLRPKQEAIVKKIIAGFDEGRGGLLIAGCGSGKTNMAIYLACHYKLKTLFIVHKNFLKRQATDRIKSTTNVTDVGTLQQKIIDIDHSFVVGMVHTLVKKDYDESVFKDFGMVIIDEVHHMGAKNFSKVFQKITGKYMLGISAERYRNDGMYKIINWYMGPILHVEEQEPNDMVLVKRFHYQTSNKERSEVIINRYTKEPDRSTMVTNLIHIKKRNRFIYHVVEQLYDLGRNILFLSGRIKHVELLYKFLEENVYTRGNVGKYLGGMSEEQLQISATKQIILGTYAMAEEGLDIENLNAIILSTPKGAIKQSVGRILRREVYEEPPIVIDIVDSDNQVFMGTANVRMQHYKRQNYNIQSFKISDYPSEGYTNWDDVTAIQQMLAEIPKRKQIPVKEKCELPNIQEYNFRNQ